MSAAGASAAAGAAAAQIAQAVKASGTIVRMSADDFLAILGKQEHPLVVHATTGLVRKKYTYLTSYKGLAFFTKGSAPVKLPHHVELVSAKKIWIP